MREVEDPDFPGPCPECGSTASITERCDRCPVTQVEHVRATTEAGRLLERVLELDFDTQRFVVGWNEVTCEDNKGLKILVEERGKWEKEENERKREEAEMERRVQEMKRGR